MITEITSVIAVVLHLGLQIRDNTKVLRSQAHHNALSLALRPVEMMIENVSLATIVNTGYKTPEALSADGRSPGRPVPGRTGCRTIWS